MLMLFFFGALPIDTLKIKHTKKLKEIPSRHVLDKVNRCLARYSPRATTANQPTNRAK